MTFIFILKFLRLNMALNNHALRSSRCAVVLKAQSLLPSRPARRICTCCSILRGPRRRHRSSSVPGQSMEYLTIPGQAFESVPALNSATLNSVKQRGSVNLPDWLTFAGFATDCSLPVHLTKPHDIQRKRRRIFFTGRHRRFLPQLLQILWHRSAVEDETLGEIAIH